MNTNYHHHYHYRIVGHLGYYTHRLKTLLIAFLEHYYNNLKSKYNGSHKTTVTRIMYANIRMPAKKITVLKTQ